jgi:hypothetical protein
MGEMDETRLVRAAIIDPHYFRKDVPKTWCVLARSARARSEPALPDADESRSSTAVRLGCPVTYLDLPSA